MYCPLFQNKKWGKNVETSAGMISGPGWKTPKLLSEFSECTDLLLNHPNSEGRGRKGRVDVYVNVDWFIVVGVFNDDNIKQSCCMQNQALACLILTYMSTCEIKSQVSEVVAENNLVDVAISDIDDSDVTGKQSRCNSCRSTGDVYSVL